MILDSGERRVYENGFQRDMANPAEKGRFDLLPWGAIWELAKHTAEGAEKYGERNIDLGCKQSSLVDSAFRHLAKYVMGMRDENHLRAAFWNIGWALQQEVYRPDMLDIPPMKATNGLEVDCSRKKKLFYEGKEVPETDEKVQAVIEELLTPYEEAAMTLSEVISDLAAKEHAEHFWERDK